MSTKQELQVYQTLLDEHGGNFEHAFIDLCSRFVAVLTGVSPGYLRWGMNVATAEELKADPPPVDDGSWLETGKE